MDIKAFFAISLIVVGIIATSFFLDAIVIYAICWCFGLVFSWKIAFGIWLILLLIGGLFKSNN